MLNVFFFFICVNFVLSFWFTFLFIDSTMQLIENFQLLYSSSGLLYLSTCPNIRNGVNRTWCCRVFPVFCWCRKRYKPYFVYFCGIRAWNWKFCDSHCIGLSDLTSIIKDAGNDFTILTLDTQSINATWWRHQMETFSALLAICAGNSPVPVEFLAQRPVTRSFDVFFDLRLNKRLSKQSWSWWFETLSCPLWRHRNVNLTIFIQWYTIYLEWVCTSGPFVFRRHGFHLVLMYHYYIYPAINKFTREAGALGMVGWSYTYMNNIHISYEIRIPGLTSGRRIYWYLRSQSSPAT